MTIAAPKSTFTVRTITLYDRLSDSARDVGAKPALVQRDRSPSKARIADYKRVRELDFVDRVPHTASGKILRRELAERERAKAATPS